MDEIIKDFVLESREGLERVDQHLVVLERDPEDREALRAIFRTLHSIKGTCGFLGFRKLETLSHVAENLLGRLRDGHLLLTPERISALLELVDAARRGLIAIEESHAEGDEDFADVIQKLGELGGGHTADAEPASARSQPPLGEAMTAQVELPPQVEPPARTPAAPSPVAPPAPLPQAQQQPLSATGTTTAALDDTIRVDVALLDEVMNLVGELVLVRNQLLLVAGRDEDKGTQRLDRVATDLQESVMKMRMQPMGTLWSRFPRMTRDLALSFNKHVQLSMAGHATELDRSLLEAIRAPLTHLLRNAIDHGIESPRSRKATGKPEGGHINLRAFHEEGQVIIELADDGAGIDAAHIKSRVVARGLISAERAAAMSERELLHLIFLPGFSTADAVTSVSGRGVGMDVVRTNIENIGGTVDIDTVVGRGTTVRLKIPLTLAIIPALTVQVANEIFAIPQSSLLEMVWLDAEQARRSVERIQGVPLYRLRGEILPLVYLDEQLALRPPDAAQEIDEARGLSIVVVTVEDHRFGVVVDEINDTKEIVVKPLGRELKGLKAFAGATIMGDGRVALILDVTGLAHHARVIQDVQRLRPLPATEERPVEETRESWLLFVAGGGLMGIPASHIVRLEEFPREQIERAGDQDVVQHRGQILPLVHLTEILPERRRTPRESPGDATRDDGKVPVIICDGDRGDVGLVVRNIVDIVEESPRVRREGGRLGVRCSAVIHDRVTELLDLDQVLRMHAATLASPGG